MNAPENENQQTNWLKLNFDKEIRERMALIPVVAPNFRCFCSTSSDHPQRKQLQRPTSASQSP